MRWARPSPHSSSSSMALARTCLFLHAAIIILILIIFIVLQLGLRVTVAQLSMANKSVLPTKERSLKGREEKVVVAGLTGHTEVVRVVFSPKDVNSENLLKVFWENHDPTQGMAQGYDHGTQYRSAIYTYSPEQQELAMRSKHMYQEALTKKGLSEITTEIREHT